MALTPYDISDDLVSLQAEHVEGKGHTILFVDDELSTLKSLSDLYRRSYTVLTANSADAAEIILANHGKKISTIASDQRMPHRTGVELLAVCRSLYPTITRVLVTGYADIAAVIDAINRAHVDRYVTKPWEPIDFDRILRQSVALNVLKLRGCNESC